MSPLAAQSALAFLGGMAVNFMPCVLPVMPIKLQALLGKRQEPPVHGP